MTFKEAIVKGFTKPEDINDWMRGWHNSRQNKIEPWQHLGMTYAEYMDWMNAKVDIVTLASKWGAAV